MGRARSHTSTPALAACEGGLGSRVVSACTARRSSPLSWAVAAPTQAQRGVRRERVGGRRVRSPSVLQATPTALGPALPANPAIPAVSICHGKATEPAGPVRAVEQRPPACRSPTPHSPTHTSLVPVLAILTSNRRVAASPFLSWQKSGVRQGRNSGSQRSGAPAMDYDELVAKVIRLLQREKRRAPYRSLKRRFDVDDDYVADLKIDLIEAKRLAIDENDENSGLDRRCTGRHFSSCSPTPRPAASQEQPSPQTLPLPNCIPSPRRGKTATHRDVL